jgi:radical SAM superfamily enzyme YgiQ (UPF0313 family)
MRALASSLHVWRTFELREKMRGRHDLTFALAIVEAIGKSHGLELTAEETTKKPASSFDAIFISVLDSRVMCDTAKHFEKWKIPLRRRERKEPMPLVFAGGQGLRNPLPYAEIADVIVIGDAEEPLPALLRLWDRHGRSAEFFEEAATVPGVFVPSVHDRRRDTIVQSVSSDISTSLRSDVRVSLDGSRRLEIARGCRYRCPYCSLGWRAEYRENDADAIITAMGGCPRRIHLQAGDAESHSGILRLRDEVKRRGMIDLSWTGRPDTLMRRLEMDGSAIPSQKRYALGIEGCSEHVRAIIGRRWLTDDRLIELTLELWRRVENDRVGRLCWHLMGGLPGEKLVDGEAMLRVLRELDTRRTNETVRNLEIHWQPFQPLPGTPMQWCAAGAINKYIVRTLAFAEDLPFARVHQYTGRTNQMAQITTILSRSDERGVELLEAMGRAEIMSPKAASELTGATAGALDVDAELPWDFVRTHVTRETLACRRPKPGP